jgi:hypothetical protein
VWQSGRVSLATCSSQIHTVQSHGLQRIISCSIKSMFVSCSPSHFLHQTSMLASDTQKSKPRRAPCGRQVCLGANQTHHMTNSTFIIHIGFSLRFASIDLSMQGLVNALAITTTSVSKITRLIPRGLSSKQLLQHIGLDPIYAAQ